jgi:hypothetical protein
LQCWFIPRFCGKVVGLLRLPLPLLFLLHLRAFRLAARPRDVQFLAPPDAKNVSRRDLGSPAIHCQSHLQTPSQLTCKLGIFSSFQAEKLNAR